MMKKICVMAMFLLLICSVCTASFSSSKMKIGDVDGEWTYIGRYRADTLNYPTLKEWLYFAKPYNEQTEKNGVVDVYFYHVHGDGGHNHAEGVGCRRHKTYQPTYNCVLKLVKLDEKGNPLRKPGIDGATTLLGIDGYPGVHEFLKLKLVHYRAYDVITHQLIKDVNAKDNSEVNMMLNDGVEYHNKYIEKMHKKYGNNGYKLFDMYWKAASISNCPITPEPKYEY